MIRSQSTTEPTAADVAEAVLLRMSRRADEAAARYDPTALHHALRKLACAVLRQALVDASGIYGESGGNGYREEAQRFLSESEEFTFWCRLAGVNPRTARKNATLNKRKLASKMNSSS